MHFTTDTATGHTVIRCEGRLNLVSAPDLKTQITEAVDHGPAKVVVDLSGTTFVDSSGLGALIGGLKLARQRGGDLRIAGATTQVTTVLRLTNLDRVLRPYADVTDATRDW